MIQNYLPKAGVMTAKKTDADVQIHASSLVETASIGSGTRIWAFTHILAGALIGENCNIGDHCFIEHGVVIGDFVTIKNGNAIFEGVTIEAGAFVGPNVTFTNDRYPRSPRLDTASPRYKNGNWLARTLIKRGASIGGGVVILPGLVIGEFAMIGAGAVVTKDVLPYTLVYGNPGRIHGFVCECSAPLFFSENNAESVKVNCTSCNKHYNKQGNIVLKI